MIASLIDRYSIELLGRSLSVCAFDFLAAVVAVLRFATVAFTVRAALLPSLQLINLVNTATGSIAAASFRVGLAGIDYDGRTTMMMNE